MYTDGNPGSFGCLHHHRADFGERRHSFVKLGVCDDDRDVQLFCGREHCVDALQIRGVESTHSVTVFFRNGKDLR